MGKCVNASVSVGKGELHGHTGTKLDSEASQIACEMKQTTPEKKKRKNSGSNNNTKTQKSDK